MKTVSRISARCILDSRGEWTIEVVLTLLSGAVGIASVPQGKSVSGRAKTMLSANDALARIKGVAVSALLGKTFADQAGFDHALHELDGTKSLKRLGANGMLALSLAFARASSIRENVPLYIYVARAYAHLAGESAPRAFPRLYVNMINGGLHAGGGLAVQEYLVIPKSRKPREAIDSALRFYHALRSEIEHEYGSASTALGDEGGFALREERIEAPLDLYARTAERLGLSGSLDYGLDVAGGAVADTVTRSLMRFEALADSYPLIYIEDPFGEKKARHFSALMERIGSHVVIAGDDITATNTEHMAELHEAKAVNGVIIKPNQIGTLSDTLRAVVAARDFGWSVVVSHRSGETNDSAIADIACGIGADGFKIGAPARGERVAKYNRLLEIEAKESS